MNPRGLTLIEVLAATALLTLVAGSGLTLVRQAAQAQRLANRASRTSEVIRAWTSEFPELSMEDLTEGNALQRLQSWQFQEDDGVVWRARVEAVQPVAGVPPVAEESATRPQEPVQWILVTFERSEARAERFLAVTTLLRACSSDPRRREHRP